jgi:hypothetical protein
VVLAVLRPSAHHRERPCRVSSETKGCGQAIGSGGVQLVPGDSVSPVSCGRICGLPLVTCLVWCLARYSPLRYFKGWAARARLGLPAEGRDRLALQPDRTVGTAAGDPPESSGPDGCLFDLCPYPPKGNSHIGPGRAVARFGQSWIRPRVFAARGGRDARGSAPGGLCPWWRRGGGRASAGLAARLVCRQASRNLCSRGGCRRRW